MSRAKARDCMRPGFAQAWTGEGARPHTSLLAAESVSHTNSVSLYTNPLAIPLGSNGDHVQGAVGTGIAEAVGRVGEGCESDIHAIQG